MNRNLKYCILALMLILCGCSESKQTERLFSHFVKRHIERVKPLKEKYSEAIWETYTGKSSFSKLLEFSNESDSIFRSSSNPPEYYQSLLNNVYDNSSEFEILQKINKSGLIKDPMLHRQFMKLFREYLVIHNNWDNSEKQQAQLFEQFFDLKKSETAFFDSIKNTQSDVDARELWMERFTSLSSDFKKLIESKNNDARKMGYQNYFELEMDFNGVDYNHLNSFINIIEEETHSDYLQLIEMCKNEICKQYGIKANQIEPWHYTNITNQMHFPKAWNKTYTQAEAIDIINRFFGYGAFDTETIIKKSDLWYQKDKIDQSFFYCPDLDKKDLRIYANIQPNTRGIYVLMHEFGHALHYASIDQSIPYILKEPNTISTEAVAIYFNDKLYNSPSLRNLMSLPETNGFSFYDVFSDPSRLFFIRKMIRTIRFQQAIFENPDQDFNQLWWDLTDRYLYYNTSDKQRLPEWITSQHIIYVNGIHVYYLYALAIAAQLEAYYPDDVIGPVIGFMKHGDAHDWQQLIEMVTGEKLNLNYLFNSYRKDKKPYLPQISLLNGSDYSYLNNYFKNLET